MLELGKYQSLIIVKRVEFGAYLSEELGSESEEQILLPLKQVPNDAAIGDEIEVFIYKDSKDRIIATTNKPLFALGEVADLKVAQVGQFGAFLDWGLEKELLLPFKEQTAKVKEGEQCLVALYVDKSQRLCATMNVYEYLSLDSPYQTDDRIEGRVYQISNEFGAFVAVDNKYSALIPLKEMYGEVKIGDTIKARVSSVKADGKLDLSIREKAYLQMETNVDKVLMELESRGGSLPFTDKANPELIKEELAMSKNEFKRAIGNLMKAKKVEILKDSIKLI